MKTVYLDSCAWQTLSGGSYADGRHRLAVLCKEGSLRFAWSWANVEERVHGVDCSSPDSKRVRTAQTMIGLVSRHHLFRDRGEIIEGGRTHDLFYAVHDKDATKAWNLLTELAKPKPSDVEFLRHVQQERNRYRETEAAELQKKLEDIEEMELDDGALARDVLSSVRHGQIVEIARGVCGGGSGIAGLFCRVHMLLGLVRRTAGDALERGDVVDMDHLVFGALADAFATDDGGLFKLAKTLRDDLGEQLLSFGSLREFLGTQLGTTDA